MNKEGPKTPDFLKALRNMEIKCRETQGDEPKKYGYSAGICLGKEIFFDYEIGKREQADVRAVIVAEIRDVIYGKVGEGLYEILDLVEGVSRTEDMPRHECVAKIRGLIELIGV